MNILITRKSVEYFWSFVYTRILLNKVSIFTIIKLNFKSFQIIQSKTMGRRRCHLTLQIIQYRLRWSIIKRYKMKYFIQGEWYKIPEIINYKKVYYVILAINTIFRWKIHLLIILWPMMIYRSLKNNMFIKL